MGPLQGFVKLPGVHSGPGLDNRQQMGGVGGRKDLPNPSALEPAVLGTRQGEVQGAAGLGAEL